MLAKPYLQAQPIAVLAIGYLVSLIAYSRLPGPFLAQTPSARILVAFTLPTTALTIYALFRSLWIHDRVRSGNGAFESTYNAIVFRTLLFVVVLHTLVMMELTGAREFVDVQLSGSRVVIVMLGILFVAIGNLLPRTRPNVAVGLRTARTLSNPQIWQRVHRASGYAAVGFGIVVVLAGLATTKSVMGPIISAAALGAAMAVSIAYFRNARLPG
jgi:hypothetical protein